PTARDLLESVELQLAVLIERNRLERRTRTLGDVLPGDEVGVVLELGDDDDVAGAEVVEAPGVGDEIDAFSGAVREHDLAGGRRVDELRDLLSSALVLRGCQLGQRVDASMDVCVGRLVEGAQLVEHLPWFVSADG